MYSVSNLDVLCGERLDLAICLNPLSSSPDVDSRSRTARATATVRRTVGRRLAEETTKLRQEGTPVVVLEPSAQDVEVMGSDFMSSNNRIAITKQARKSVAQQVRHQRRTGAPLPARSR